ncbi:MAG: hypothetical protein ACRD96_03575, partial [Bryobacteraceae bacterium]
AELFATAFKKRMVNSSPAEPRDTTSQNSPGTIYNVESGFRNSGFVGHADRGDLGVAGRADNGNRVAAVFANVPTGVTLFVDRCAAPLATPLAVGNYTISGTNCNGSVTSATNFTGGLTTGGPDFALRFTSETGNTEAEQSGTVPIGIDSIGTTAFWQVAQSDSLSLSTFNFGLYINYTANPAGNSPGLGTITVAGSYAPRSTQGLAATDPIPRFADTGVATNIISIAACRTNLLYPYVTNQGGFDTGLAIAATATDPFGTAPQGGTCALNWYGANAPAAANTPTIASGTVHTLLTSVAAPNFQGYMIAVCQFQYAHGFAFVSDLGFDYGAMGYLALVIPDPPRSANYPTSGSPSGEQLGN